MNVIFYMWLDIHKYICMIQSIHMGVSQVHLGMPKVISILNLQYVNPELSYDVDSLYMHRHPKEPQID